MLIIGCDFHTRYQQIAMLDESTAEMVERRLEHENGEAHKFYRDLPKPVRVGRVPQVLILNLRVPARCMSVGADWMTLSAPSPE